MCTVTITSATATESNGQVTSVTINGTSEDCKRVTVSFTCQGERLSKTVPVGPGGTWQAVFDTLDDLNVARCECEGRVRVEAVCVDDPRCRDQWEGRLECEDREKPCEVKITSVKGTESGGQVASVTVEGSATHCSAVEVRLNCHGQAILQTVPVGPGGSWTAVFDHTTDLKLAECRCNGRVGVEAVCVDDRTCMDRWEDELPCEEEEPCKIQITSATATTSSDGQVTSVTINGTAEDCKRVTVSFTCQGEILSKTVPVGPGGDFTVEFLASDGRVPADCECEGRVRVEAVCADDPRCRDQWEGRLECIRDCHIEITSVMGMESEGNVKGVTIKGTAVHCEKVTVSFACPGKKPEKEVVVGPGGDWTAVFDNSDGLREAECECGGPIQVDVRCTDNFNCRAWWEGPLECVEPCEIEIESATATVSGGQVTSVTIKGSAVHCKKVRVTFTCQGEKLSKEVAVGPGGAWTAVFDDSDGVRRAECKCDGPVRVEAVCVDDPDCRDRLEGKLECVEPCKINIDSVTPTVSGDHVASVTVEGAHALALGFRVCGRPYKEQPAGHEERENRVPHLLIPSY